MKKILLLLTVILNLFKGYSQNIGIGTTTPDASARLDITSTTSGLLIPRMTSVQRAGIATPAKGLLVFDTDSNSFWFYNAASWINLPVSVWSLTGNAGTNPPTHFLGTTDNQPLRWRVNNTWAGELHPATGNIFMGLRAGQNTTGFSNIAFGTDAMKLNTNPSNLIAIGDSALFNNSTGISLVAVGSKALYSNTTGNQNTATGALALRFNNTGRENTANGYAALYSNTMGVQNTANGHLALFSNTAGNNNTANGKGALSSNTTGFQNTAIGNTALYSNVAGSNATAIGYNAMFYANDQVTPFTNRNVALGFEALRGSATASNNTGNNNTALGYQTLFNNTTGNQNTATGNSALYSNTTGSFNTANGNSALYFNTTAANNTAIGNFSLYSQSYNGGGTGGWNTYNTAVGTYSLFANQPTSISNGIFNTAIGSFALSNNTTGYENTATGYYAGLTNISGVFNSFFGSRAGASSNGNNNTAMGQNALLNNTAGSGNVAVGADALQANTGGSQNTCIGIGSDVDLTNTNNNTIIGAFAHINGSSSIVVGYSAYTNTNNLALLGNPSTLYTGGYTNWSNFSDGRFKTRVDEEVKGLDFIMRLRPVTYHMNVKAIYNLWGISPYGKHDENAKDTNDKLTASMKTEMDNAISNKEAIRMSGFIAQEVEKAAQQSGYDFDGVIKPAHDKDHYRLAYGAFAVPLVKAMQELNAINNEKDKQIADLEIRLKRLELIISGKQ